MQFTRGFNSSHFLLQSTIIIADNIIDMDRTAYNVNINIHLNVSL